MSITQAYQRIRSEVPDSITIVLAAKTRTKEEVLEAIDAGCTHLGHNYLQEAEEMIPSINHPEITWHMIGHLQRRKIKKAIPLFSMIQTVDSFEKAVEINKRASGLCSTLLEINIADEANKKGHPSDFEMIEKTIKAAEGLSNIKIEGLMTMGPWVDNPEELRPYFRKTKEYYDRLIDAGYSMNTLSMGMSDSYRIAIEEGSTMIRLGTSVFGARS